LLIFPVQVAAVIVAVIGTNVCTPTETIAVAEQVLDKSVTVTVNTPDKVVTIVDNVLVNPDGPDQLYPGLAVTFRASSVTLGTAQVMLPEVVAVTEGIELSVGTLMVTVATQPVRVFVTLKVKLPQTVTVGF
jgi:hypothetical protein